MKKLGLIGGMSWESTVVYYQLLNRLARQKQGGLHSADCLLWSFNFAEIEAYQSFGDWEGVTQLMIEAAVALESGGAQCILICTNTMHKMAADVESAVNIPLLHIADATAPAIKKSDCRRPLLLATRYTMEQDFYKGYLQEHHAIDVMIPDEQQRTVVHNIIYEELCVGVIREESRAQYIEIIKSTDADGVILGCTEVGLLLSQADIELPCMTLLSYTRKPLSSSR